MQKEEYKLIALSATIFTALTIFLVSSMSFPAGSGSGSLNLKPIIYHIGIFFFLQFFLLLTLESNNDKTLSLAILASITYAILDEIHQFFVPGRALSILDMAFDTIGILGATAIYNFKKTF